MFACRISSCTTYTSSLFPLRSVAYVCRNVCQPKWPTISFAAGCRCAFAQQTRPVGQFSSAMRTAEYPVLLDRVWTLQSTGVSIDIGVKDSANPSRSPVVGQAQTTPPTNPFLGSFRFADQPGTTLLVDTSAFLGTGVHGTPAYPRSKDGVFVEHWDVLQDEVTQEQSKSGLPMFGKNFPSEPVNCADQRLRKTSINRI